MYQTSKAAFFLVLTIIGCGTVFGQLKKPLIDDSLFSTYYHQRVSHFNSLPSKKGQIVFLGNSLTDGAEWSELFNDTRIINRGISGDVSTGIMHRVDEIVNRKPEKIFLLIGTNDLSREVTVDSLLKNMLWLADYIRQESPSTKLFIQSVLPVNDVYGKFQKHTGNKEKIILLNKKLSESASRHRFQFLELAAHFADAAGRLNRSLSNDGLHLNGDGYSLWKHLVYPFVYDLQPKAALLPLPQKVQWLHSYFPVYKCRTVLVRDTVLLKEAVTLQGRLSQQGILVKITGRVPAGPYIELKLGSVQVPRYQEEAYHLQVSDQSVLLTANNTKGIFNGIQTLLQLARNGVMIDNCEITDWPAFAWRGYMVDAARNYQSMNLLKQQIDIMSRYKLNIFHLHLTEDIAWRLSVKQYPQLVAADNMLRNKGQYYSEADLKELIAYCEARYITLIPEIDMPGHSAAFTRAVGYGMQTDTGLKIV